MEHQPVSKFLPLPDKSPSVSHMDFCAYGVLKAYSSSVDTELFMYFGKLCSRIIEQNTFIDTTKKHYSRENHCLGRSKQGLSN